MFDLLVDQRASSAAAVAIGTGGRGRVLSPAFGWLMVVAGLVSTLYAWQIRHPLTTADFTLFYRSAELPPDRMYEPPPGPPRNNMNPPQFQILMRPLTLLPLGMASAVFRGVSIACLCACVWWVARTSDERWTAGDLGALLAWSPMAVTLSLNQVTWLLWPLLVCSWYCWRANRWTAGAIAFGIALSLKPFLLIVAAWLLLSGRVRTALVTGATAATAFAVGALCYGSGVFVAWIAAISHVQWWAMGLNASLMGSLTRMAAGSNNAVASVPAPVRWLGTLGAAAVIGITLVATREWPLARAWTPLMAAALLASPLGWVYYAWWLLPGERPSRLILLAPTLWLPFGLPGLPTTVSSHVVRFLLAATIGSAYFWGLFVLWLSCLRAPVPARHSEMNPA